MALFLLRITVSTPQHFKSISFALLCACTTVNKSCRKVILIILCPALLSGSQVRLFSLNQPVKCREKNKKNPVTGETINSATIELGWGGGGGGGILQNSTNLLLNFASCPAEMDYEVGKSAAHGIQKATRTVMPKMEWAKNGHF